ncbi:hypothetical protein [Actinomycetospora cinnamomea]|nr:hypothetical protein [Actinomycetospora cinnamomea]
MIHDKMMGPHFLRQAFEEGPDAVLWCVESQEDFYALREARQSVTGSFGEFSHKHAAQLRPFSGLLLIGVTLDDAGAFEARRRWLLVTEVLSARQVQFRAPARDLWEGATFADHFAEGYTLDETRRVSLRDMRSAIEREEDRRRTQDVAIDLQAAIARAPKVRTGVAS